MNYKPWLLAACVAFASQAALAHDDDDDHGSSLKRKTAYGPVVGGILRFDCRG